MSWLGGCGSLLPKGEALTQSPWQSYQDAEQTFQKIVPHQTTVEDLQRLQLDPGSNPNVTVLSYSDIVRRFIPSPSLSSLGVEEGVQECLKANAACMGYEVDHQVLKRNRYGSFVADFLNFHRKVDVVGWRFNAVILIKDKLVVYKLTGGQPAIHERQEAFNPLGPLQGGGEMASLEQRPSTEPVSPALPSAARNGAMLRR